LRQAEAPLQQDLPRRGVEQVGAAHDLGDALQRIVDDHRQLVGPVAVGARKHEVADFLAQVLRCVPRMRSREFDRASGDAQSPCRVAAMPARDAGAVHARRSTRGPNASRSIRRHRRSPRAWRGRGVVVAALALEQHWSVGQEAEVRERLQLLSRGAGLLARRVEVFHAHEPSPPA
jgi:hypothetical protein